MSTSRRGDTATLLPNGKVLVSAAAPRTASRSDRDLLSPPETKTWPLEQAAEAYQTVLDGSGGIKQVLLPTGGEA